MGLSNKKNRIIAKKSEIWLPFSPHVIIRMRKDKICCYTTTQKPNLLRVGWAFLALVATASVVG